MRFPSKRVLRLSLLSSTSVKCPRWAGVEHKQKKRPEHFDSHYQPVFKTFWALSWMCIVATTVGDWVWVLTADRVIRLWLFFLWVEGSRPSGSRWQHKGFIASNTFFNRRLYSSCTGRGSYDTFINIFYFLSFPKIHWCRRQDKWDLADQSWNKVQQGFTFVILHLYASWKLSTSWPLCS